MRADPYGAVRRAPGRGCRKDPLPVGTVVIRDDGNRADGRRRLVRMIKVRPDGPQQARWKSYARWWWESNRGPVPPGKSVIHLNGKTLDDSPENLAIGDHADRVVLAHMRNPEWSKAQHALCAAGTAEHNRFAGKLHRLRHVLPRYWYPVWDRGGVIFNAPFRRRKTLLIWFGVDVTGYPENGQARKLLEKIAETTEVRAVRGGELETGILQSYLRVDPEFVVSAGREKLSLDDEERIKVLSKSEVWKRAEAAARTDLKERK